MEIGCKKKPETEGRSGRMKTLAERLKEAFVECDSEHCENEIDRICKEIADELRKECKEGEFVNESRNGIDVCGWVADDIADRIHKCPKPKGEVKAE